MNCLQCGESVDKQLVVMMDGGAVHAECRDRYLAIKAGLTHICQRCYGRGGRDVDADYDGPLGFCEPRRTRWEPCYSCRGGMVRDVPKYVVIAEAALRGSPATTEAREDCEMKIAAYEKTRRGFLGRQGTPC